MGKSSYLKTKIKPYASLDCPTLPKRSGTPKTFKKSRLTKLSHTSSNLSPTFAPTFSKNTLQNKSSKKSKKPSKPTKISEKSTIKNPSTSKSKPKESKISSKRKLATKIPTPTPSNYLSTLHRLSECTKDSCPVPRWNKPARPLPILGDKKSHSLTCTPISPLTISMAREYPVSSSISDGLST
jgi:hypothetical protein